MAVVQNPITGRSKQKYASAIFSTWKGINVLRSLPLSVANPKTPGQLLQRMKLRKTVALYRLLPGVVKVGYRQQAVKKSEYNAFASETMRNAFTGSTAENVAIDLAKLNLAKGTMAATEITSFTGDPSTYTITWDGSAPLAPGQAASDKAYAAIVGEESVTGDLIVVVAASPVDRTSGTIDLPRDTDINLEEIQGFLFFASIVGTQVSDDSTAPFDAG